MIICKTQIIVVALIIIENVCKEMKEEDEWILKYRAQKVISVIGLKDIVSKIETELK